MSNDSSSPVEAQPATPERTGHWIAPFSIVYVLVAFFVAQIIASLAIYGYGAAQGWSEPTINTWLGDSVPAQFFFVLLTEAVLLAGVVLGMKYLRWTLRTIGLVRPTRKHLAIGVLATVPYYLLYVAIVTVVAALVPALNVDQKQEIGFENVTGNLALVFTFISLVILPPLAEEITMRGFLYSGLRTWLPKIGAALLVSVIFGAAHLSGGGDSGLLWIGALDTFALSLVLVYLREKTGNLWAGITLHACKNGIAFVLLFIIGVA